MNEKNKILIAIADDSRIFREGLKKCMASDKALEVIVEAGNGEDGEQQAHNLKTIGPGIAPDPAQQSPVQPGLVSGLLISDVTSPASPVHFLLSDH